MRSIIYFAFIFSVILNCKAINICGLEELAYCNPKNKTCLMEVEPAARRWFINGRPEYGLAPINPTIIEIMPLKVNDKVYVLHYVNMTGFENLILSNWIVDIPKFQFTYDYDHKLNITIGKFVDEKGNNLIGDKPLSLHLVNTHTSTTVSFNIIKRCDNSAYFTFTNPSAKVREIEDGDIVLEDEIKSKNKNEIIKELGKALSLRSNRVVSQTWKQFTATSPLKDYWKLHVLTP